jgi:hypothetical protein
MPCLKMLKNEIERKGNESIANGLFCNNPNILPFTVDCIPLIVPHPGQNVPVVLYHIQGGI